MHSFRPRRGDFRPRSRVSHFNPKNGAKTLQQIERFIEESKNSPTFVDQFSIIHSFNDFQIPQVLKDAIFECGYTEPTPIQDKVIPEIINGNDLIGIANTGTGKTAAFLVPLITRILKKEIHKAIILAPTRELALQIQDDFWRLAKNCGLRSVLCIGGTSVKGQIKQLSKQFDILIGTPGRVKDMMGQQVINLRDFDSVVLDEVDRMLDMGFIRDVRELLEALPDNRQTLFFSATLPKEVQSLCQTFASNPVVISVRTTEYAHTVEQKIVRLSQNQRKLDVLYDLLCQQKEYKKVIIFGRTKHGVKRLARELDERGFSVDSLHGNKSQAARQRSLEQFRRDSISILVATDVAARGIDVTDITHVINYDIPETVDDYIHRIGRTGRAGNIGIALTFVDA